MTASMCSTASDTSGWATSAGTPTNPSRSYAACMSCPCSLTLLCSFARGPTPDRGPHCPDDRINLREQRLHQLRCVWNRRVCRGDARYRSVEVLEGRLLHRGG